MKRQVFLSMKWRVPSSPDSPPSLNPSSTPSPPWPMPHRRALLAAAMSALTKLVDQLSSANATAFCHKSFSQSFFTSRRVSGRNSSADVLFPAITVNSQRSTLCVGSMPPASVALHHFRNHAPFSTRSQCSHGSATTTLSTALDSTNRTAIFSPSPPLAARSSSSNSTSYELSHSPVTLNGVPGENVPLPSAPDVLTQAPISGREKAASSTQRRRRPSNLLPASDLLTVPGVGPRNLEKLMAKGIDQVASLTQLYREKVRDTSNGHSSERKFVCRRLARILLNASEVL